MSAREDLEHISTRQDELTEALVSHADAKYNLETQKANSIVAGVEGKNQAERDANLRTQLSENYQAEHHWNKEVIKAKGKYANALRTFDLSVIEFNKSPKEMPF